MKKFKPGLERDEDFINEEVEATPFDPFLSEGWITEVVQAVKSGKEATVYTCRGGVLSGADLVAVKVYIARENRNFKNDTIYQEGRVILDKRAARAVKKKTSFGREAQAGMWTGYEFEFLKHLYKSGASVPRPIVQRGEAILLEYLCDEDAPAPILNNVDLDPAEARPLFDHLMRNVELLLKHNLVHGDLSPFNVLYWQGKVTIIDFPQAVDPRFNPNALMLLTRDIENLCRYFSKYGVQADGKRLAERLWQRFKNSQL